MKQCINVFRVQKNSFDSCREIYKTAHLDTHIRSQLNAFRQYHNLRKKYSE